MTSTLKYTIPTLFILLIGFNTKAQISLNLEECRGLAIEYSHSMEIADQQRNKAKYEKNSYKAMYLPSLSAMGAYYYQPGPLEYNIGGGYLPTYVPGADGQLSPNLLLDASGNTVIGADGNPIFQEYAYMPDTEIEIGLEGVGMAGLAVVQPIYMGGKIRSANQMADLAKELAEENYRLNRADVIVEADEAYWQYINVQEKLKSAEEYAALLEELYKNINDAVEVGMAKRNDLLKVSVKRNEAALMVQKATNGKDLARMNLCRVVGLPFETLIEITDSLKADITSVYIDQSASINNRPELQIVNKDSEIKAKHVNVVRADYLPQISVMGTYSYYNGLQLNGTTSSDTFFSAMATVSVPIFGWGEGRNKIKSAKAEQLISQAKMEKYQELMALEAAQADYNIKNAQAKLTLTESSLEQAKENLKISSDMYNTGMESLSDHLEAQAQLQKAHSDYIDACAELKLSETKYMKAIGTLDQVEIAPVEKKQ